MSLIHGLMMWCKFKFTFIFSCNSYVQLWTCVCVCQTLSVLVPAVRDVACMWLWRFYPTWKCLENVPQYSTLAQLLWQPEPDREDLVVPVIRSERKTLSKSQLTASPVCLVLSLLYSHSARVPTHLHTHTYTPWSICWGNTACLPWQLN